jgi:hypothetical protein
VCGKRLHGTLFSIDQNDRRCVKRNHTLRFVNPLLGAAILAGVLYYMKYCYSERKENRSGRRRKLGDVENVRVVRTNHHSLMDQSIGWPTVRAANYRIIYIYIVVVVVVVRRHWPDGESDGWTRSGKRSAKSFGGDFVSVVRSTVAGRSVVSPS